MQAVRAGVCLDFRQQSPPKSTSGMGLKNTDSNRPRQLVASKFTAHDYGFADNLRAGKNRQQEMVRQGSEPFDNALHFGRRTGPLAGPGLRSRKLLSANKSSSKVKSASASLGNARRTS